MNKFKRLLDSNNLKDMILVGVAIFLMGLGIWTLINQFVSWAILTSKGV